MQDTKTRPQKPPEKKIGPFASGIGVAIWLNEGTAEDGSVRFFRSVTINPAAISIRSLANGRMPRPTSPRTYRLCSSVSRRPRSIATRRRFPDRKTPMPLDWKTKPVADSDRWLSEPIPKRIRLGINFVRTRVTTWRKWRTNGGDDIVASAMTDPAT